MNPSGYNDTIVGWFGFSNGVGVNVGAILGGIIFDRYMKGKYKKMFYIGIIGMVLTSLVFTLSCDSFLFSVPPL